MEKAEKNEKGEFPPPKKRRIKRGRTIENISDYRMSRSSIKNNNRNKNIPFNDSTIEVLLDSSKNMLLVINPENLEILACNKTFETKINKSYLELDYLSDILPTELIESLNEIRTIQNLKMRTGNKEFLYVDIEIRPIYWAGREMMFIEITERENKEQISAKEHEEITEKIKNITAAVAHDLNNAMTVIQGNISLAEKNGTDFGDCDIESLLNAIERSKSLVKQLMYFDNETILNLLPKDLYIFLQNLLKTYSYWESDENIEIKFIENNESCVCFFDEKALFQIIQNLLHNAKDAIPEDGTITIAVNNITSDKVAIVVEDNGEGIPNENINKIFDPQFSTRRKTKNNYGLGLSIVKELTEKHGGQIMVKSRTGKGSFTRFLIIFPKTS